MRSEIILTKIGNKSFVHLSKAEAFEIRKGHNALDSLAHRNHAVPPGHIGPAYWRVWNEGDDFGALIHILNVCLSSTLLSHLIPNGVDFIGWRYHRVAMCRAFQTMMVMSVPSKFLYSTHTKIARFRISSYLQYHQFYVFLGGWIRTTVLWRRRLLLIVQFVGKPTPFLSECCTKWQDSRNSLSNWNTKMLPTWTRPM